MVYHNSTQAQSLTRLRSAPLSILEPEQTDVLGRWCFERYLEKHGEGILCYMVNHCRDYLDTFEVHFTLQSVAEYIKRFVLPKREFDDHVKKEHIEDASPPPTPPSNLDWLYSAALAELGRLDGRF